MLSSPSQSTRDTLQKIVNIFIWGAFHVWCKIPVDILFLLSIESWSKRGVFQNEKKLPYFIVRNDSRLGMKVFMIFENVIEAETWDRV